MSESQPRKNPIALGVGIGLTVFGALVLVFGNPTPAAIIALVVGVALMCAGLVQKSIERSRA